MLEGWTTIATVAGFTSKIRLGTLVTGNVYRHPSVLAKIGATLDVLSKGRLYMGIGAAWNNVESQAYGIPFPSTTERFRRLEEAVQIIRKMWTEERATFNGQFYKIRDAYCNPKPIQKPHPPIMIGGSGERDFEAGCKVRRRMQRLRFPGNRQEKTGHTSRTLQGSRPRLQLNHEDTPRCGSDG